ncbi:MAG: YqeG family HAD IIIA-type phosphatase [Lachnospirales bacterium]
MFEKLYPREYLNSVYEITVEKLNKLNIDTVIFDIDNTLVPYWIKEPDNKLISFFKGLEKNNIKLGILSNSKEERSKLFCKKMNMTYVYRAKKPGIKGLHKIAEMLDSKIEKIMLVGDQIFTDVWCANKAGAYSVLVKQISKKDELITAPKRPFEKIILKFYFRKEAKKNG